MSASAVASCAPDRSACRTTASTAALVGGGSGRPGPGRSRSRTVGAVPRRARRVRAHRARGVRQPLEERVGADLTPSRCRSPSRRPSSWSRARTRARADAGRQDVGAARRSASATDGGSAHRCSTASISASGSTHPKPTTCRASLGGRSRDRRRRYERNGRATPTGRGRRTCRSPRAWCRASLPLRRGRRRRVRELIAERVLTGRGRPASAGWPSHSPTSSTPPTSAPSTSTALSLLRGDVP